MNHKLGILAAAAICFAALSPLHVMAQSPVDSLAVQVPEIEMVTEGTELVLDMDSIPQDTIVYRHTEIYRSLFGDIDEGVFDSIPDLAANPIIGPMPYSPMFMPIIYDGQRPVYTSIEQDMAQDAEYAARPFNINDGWLRDLVRRTATENRYIAKLVNEQPQLVKYNIATLPKAPKQYVITTDAKTAKLQLEEISLGSNVGVAKEDVKVLDWLKSFVANVQFSQAYVSANWYQGGNSNLNLLGNFVYNISLNPNKYKALLFENIFQYKIGIYSTPDDPYRKYNFSEDMFQINSKFGVKAVKNWYYTATMQFKTQFFQNYASGTKTMKAAFLSPGEFNVGLGMTYNKKLPERRMTIDLNVAPISYNLKICRDITNLNPVNFGIEAGKHVANQIGSNMEFKFGWVINPSISWNTRLYAFSDYSYLQADWQNTLQFAVNKYLTTQIFLNLRYDSSREEDVDWKHWQFKEILSFGFTYKF